MLRCCREIVTKAPAEALPTAINWSRNINIPVKCSSSTNHNHNNALNRVESVDYQQLNNSSARSRMITKTTVINTLTLRFDGYGKNRHDGYQNDQRAEGEPGHQGQHRPFGYLVSLGLLGFFQKQDEKEETIEDKILMTIKRAILAIQRDDYVKAERLLHRAFKMSDAEKLEDAKTQIIDIQANLHLQKGELVQAEKMFKLVAQRLVGFGKVTAKDNSIVEISIKLAEIYKLTGRQEEAQSGFQYCIDTQKEKIDSEEEPDEDTLLLGAWALHGLAQLYIAAAATGKLQKENIETSLQLIRDAYKYAVTAVGSDSQQALAIQSDVATTYALLGDFDNALKTVEQCAEMAKDKYESLYATLKVNAGNLFLQKGDYVEAEKMCSEAKVVADRAQDPESMARALECVRRVGDLRKKQLKSGTNI